MIAGVLGLLAANVAVALAAGRLARSVSTGEPCVDVLVFLILRLLLLSGAVLLAGWTGLLTPIVLGFAGAVGTAILLAMGGRPAFRWRRPELPAPLLALFAVVALRLLLQVWFFSPHLGDALAYHLPKLGEWVRAGGFTREMGLHPHVSFPAGFELVEAWWVVFLRHDVLIEFAGVEFLVLAAAAAYALAKRADLSPRAAATAAAVYLLCPGLHLSATSCMNDAAAAALVAAAAALAVWRAPLGLLIATAGLAGGVKATAIYAMGGVILLGLLSRREAALPSRSPRVVAVLAVAALAIGASWYARNVAWYGNPVHPVGSPGYERSAVAVQSGPRLASFAGNLSDLAGERVYDRRTSLGANVDDMAGWGAAAFALGLPALPLIARRNARFRRLTIGFLASLLTSLLLVVHDPWSMKYVFYFPALLAVGAAALVEAYPGLVRILGAALLVDLLSTTLPYDLPSRDLRGLAEQPWRTRSALALPGTPPGAEALGAFGGFAVPSYLLYGPGFERRVVYLRASTADELLAAMEREGVDLVFMRPPTGEGAPVIEAATSTGRLEEEGPGFYRLIPPGRRR